MPNLDGRLVEGTGDGTRIGELDEFARRLMYVVLVAGILLDATQLLVWTAHQLPRLISGQVHLSAAGEGAMDETGSPASAELTSLRVEMDHPVQSRMCAFPWTPGKPKLLCALRLKLRHRKIAQTNLDAAPDDGHK